MIGLILAAGNGTRMGNSLSCRVIKPLIEINNKSLIEYSLHNCYEAGIKDVIIVVSESNKAEIVSKVTDSYNGMRIQYTVQENPLGLMNAVISAYDSIDDDVMLQLSDEIFIKPKMQESLNFVDSGMDFIITYTHEKFPEKIIKNFSVDIDSDGRVLFCTEKPTVVFNDMKGTGLCFFSHECIKILKEIYDEKKNFPDNLCDFFNCLTSNGKVGKAVCIAEEEININTVCELNYAQMQIKDAETE